MFVSITPAHKSDSQASSLKASSGCITMQCMERQICVRLPEDVGQALDLASRQFQRSSSEIVRLALRQYLNLDSGEQRPSERVSSLLGSLESGVPDLAKRREYILESFKIGR